MAEQPLNDADYAYLRYVEFGELPARVRPDEYVELVETDNRGGRPDSALSESQKDALYPGG
jgi:hypothetical protein